MGGENAEYGVLGATVEPEIERMDIRSRKPGTFALLAGAASILNLLVWIITIYYQLRTTSRCLLYVAAPLLAAIAVGSGICSFRLGRAKVGILLGLMSTLGYSYVLFEPSKPLVHHPITVELEARSGDSHPTGIDRGRLKDIIIDKEGEYTDAEEHLLLTVLTDGGLVDYSLTDLQTGKELLKDNSASVYHRWYLLMDQTGRLWVHSSDIGGCVWIGNRVDGYKKEVSLFKSPYIDEMPTEFKASLPSSIRKLHGL